MDPNQHNAPLEGYDFDENMPVPHPSIYPTTSSEHQAPMDHAAGPLIYGPSGGSHLHDDDDYLAPLQQFDSHMQLSTSQPPVQMQLHQPQQQHHIHHHHLHHQQQQQHPQQQQQQQHPQQHQAMHHLQQQPHLEHLPQQQQQQQQQQVYQGQQECPQESYDFYNNQFLDTIGAYDTEHMSQSQTCVHLAGQPAATIESAAAAPTLQHSYDPSQYVEHKHLSCASTSTATMDCIEEPQQPQPDQCPESTQVRHERLIASLRLLEKQSLSNGEMLSQVCQLQEECVIKGQDRAKAMSRRMNSQERGDFKGADRFKGEVANLEIILRTMARELREKKGRLWQRFSEVFKKVSQLQGLALFEYLPEWRLNQQISQNGTQVDNFTLDQMQQWCESITDIIWRTRNQLRAFHLFLRHIGCSQAASDEVNQLGFAINRSIETLILNTLVVEKQPPQVMKKNTRFSTTVRLLSGPKLNINLINPTLKVNIISENNARLIKMRHKELITQSWAFLDNQAPGCDQSSGGGGMEVQPPPQQFGVPAQQPDYLMYGQDPDSGSLMQQQQQQLYQPAPHLEHELYQQQQQHADYQQQYQPMPVNPPPPVPHQLAQQRHAPGPSSAGMLQHQAPAHHHHHPKSSTTGSSKFNQTKILNMKEFEPSGELLNSSSLLEFNELTRQVSCNFRNMQLKSIKRLKAEKKATESVLEEKFLLLFHSQFRIAESLSASDSNFGGASIGPTPTGAAANSGLLPWMSQGDMAFHMMSFSLPVAVIVHGSQESDANATITWHNAFARPDNILYQVPERVTWTELGQVLSDKFRSGAGRGLSEEQLQYLASKICRKKAGKPEESNPPLAPPPPPPPTGDSGPVQQWVTWNQFSKDKDHMPDRAFTFWEWFHSALKLTKEDLRDLWVAGRIYGFASKNDCTDLLLGSAKHVARPKGTFLIRFSETELRGITIAWVTSSSRQIDHEGCVQPGQRCSPSGSPSTVIQHVRPFGSKDLQTKRLADRLRDVKDLLYLYPDIPKDKAFNSHYTPANNAPQPPEGYVDSELVQQFGPISY